MENVWHDFDARQLVVEPDLHVSYEDIVALCCQAWNNLIVSTMEDHVPRHAQMARPMGSDQ